MKYLILPIALLLAGCASGPLSPEKQAEAEAATLAILCQPKGIYIAEGFNTHWNDQQRALYRATTDSLRIVKCPDPAALGYGSNAEPTAGTIG